MHMISIGLIFINNRKCPLKIERNLVVDNSRPYVNVEVVRRLMPSVRRWKSFIGESMVMSKPYKYWRHLSGTERNYPSGIQ